MTTMLDRLAWLIGDAEGQDLLEYSMLIALIALLAIGAVTTLGNTIHTVFWDNIAAINL